MDKDKIKVVTDLANEDIITQKERLRIIKKLIGEWQAVGSNCELTENIMKARWSINRLPFYIK